MALLGRAGSPGVPSGRADVIAWGVLSWQPSRLMATIKTFRQALEASEPRPLGNANRDAKKNYAEKLSRQCAILLANHLRPVFDGIKPDEQGREQESRARAGRGPKKLDVNYSKSEIGLGLGVSIKTVNYPDGGSSRYTKNYSRMDNELRAEAKDYHQRQPYAVLIAVVFFPSDACDDGRENGFSSFAQAVKIFRHRAGRKNPRNEEELFERVFLAPYEHTGQRRGELVFFDVMGAPPKRGRPKRELLDLKGLVAAIVRTYDERNNPTIEYATDED
jgi:hypothetical protein